VIVGASSRDIAADDPRGWRLGGPATYCSLTAARLGLRVGCLLGVDEAAADADELSLLDAAGVLLRRVRLDNGPVFENLEGDGHRRQKWLFASDSMPVAALPEEWRGAGGLLLVPVAGELGEAWAEVAPAGAAIGLGWQGLLREFCPDGWVKRVAPLPSPLLESSGLVVVSLDDLGAETELGGLQAFAQGASIVLTAGEGGGVALSHGKLLRYSAVPAAAPVDPTGAGDVFLAALMTAWLLAGEVATSKALRFAAAAASCAVEGIGLNGVPTREQVAARLGR
jgi:sugar/nucleoside kinase (ribokinase family)